MPQAEPLVYASPWTPALITALFGGLVGLLGAMTTMIVAIRSANKAASIERAIQNSKLDVIHTLVNDATTRALRLALSQAERIADLSGLPEDRAAALQAQRLYDEKSAVDRRVDAHIAAEKLAGS